MRLLWPVRLGLYCTLLCWSSPLMAAPDFPALAGRVVDNAALLSPAVRQQLTELSTQLEQETAHQYVVVTLPNLDGYDISDYGYQLGRHWGIGQQAHNNGLLLIVAQQERQIRIEVGYGLEGLVTDALASNIIHQVMRPKFKQGQYAGGIIEASELLISALKEEPIPETLRQRKSAEIDIAGVFNIALFAALFAGNLLRGLVKIKPARIGVVAGAGILAYFVSQSLLIGFGFALVLGFVMFSTMSGGGMGGYGGRSSGSGRMGGGFSGGGSFGGGGASGGW